MERKLWPNEYRVKYQLNNLWRLRLDCSWRMLYTLKGENVSIIALVLDVMDHKEYDRLFGYR